MGYKKLHNSLKGTQRWCCMIETSSVPPRKYWLAWAIFGNLRKIFEICLETFVKPSESFGKWSENFGKSSKTSLLVCLYNKQNNTWTLRDIEFIFSCSHSISHSFAALTRSIRYRCEHSKIHSISPRAHVLFSIYFWHVLFFGNKSCSNNVTSD